MDRYTVYEVAEILNTSHTTVYNKLNTKEIYKELRNFIIKQGKLRYISKEGIEALRKYVPAKESSSKVDFDNNEIKNDIIPETVDNTYQETLKEIDNQLIIELKDRIKSLENQLSIKDKQLSAKEDNTSNLTRLLENSQVLLKQQQDKVFLLESQAVEKQVEVPQSDKIESLESKLAAMNEVLKQQQDKIFMLEYPQQEEKKNWFKRWFN